MKATELWDQRFARKQSHAYSSITMPKEDDPILCSAKAYFGNVDGKTLVDLGCGSGKTSLFFASLGANVISVDLSQVAIDNLKRFCDDNEIENIKPVQLSALQLSDVGEADFVFGSMILHHIEPFDQFADVLRKTLRKDGKAYFWENNAYSNLLVWFRKNVVGKLWVPKHGDDEEFPLTRSEVDHLRKLFELDVEFPRFVYFRLIPLYLFGGHFRAPFVKLDNLCHRIKWMRKYSYRQSLYLS